MLWQQDSFAYADRFDPDNDRYLGLRGGERITLVDAQNPGVLVKPDVAAAQLARERAAQESLAPTASPGHTAATDGTGAIGPIAPQPPPKTQPTRYHGSVELDQERVGWSASRIADEVIAHLTGLVGANVRVTLEIEAEIPNGAPENVVRVVTENGRTLRFTSQGFEQE